MKNKLLSVLLLSALILTLLAAGANAEELTSGNLSYIIEGGNAVITKVDVAVSGEFTIPSLIGGYSPSTVDMYAFEDCVNITKVTIPDSITVIGENAFSGCTALKEVVIGNGVKKIDAWTFYGCSALETVTFGTGVSEISKNAFEKCSALKTVTAAGGNTKFATIDGVLFDKAQTKIEIFPQGKSGSYAVPATVTVLDELSFLDAKKLSEITVHKDIAEIKANAFSSCDSLTAITVDLANINYASENGVLFNKAKTSLIVYPENKPGTEYIVPATVTTIAAEAFRDCDILTSVVLPKGLTAIGNYAFYGCTNLVNINVPHTLTSIGESAFSLCSAISDIALSDQLTDIEKYVFFGCSSLSEVTIFGSTTTVGNSAFSYCNGLSDVYYTGASGSWSAINILSGNEKLTSARIHYSHLIVKEVLIETSASKITVSVAAENIPSNALVYFASYNNKGDMLESKQLSVNNLTDELSSESVETVKLFVWQPNLQPIFDAIEKEI